MVQVDKYKSGIKIKKSNRGKFTAYCGGNVTSSCIARAKASGNPTLVKRATFAANARKWKHQYGGHIIRKGDNLWNISKLYTGDPNNYLLIAKANNIANPNKIYVGLRINIPSSLLPSLPKVNLPDMYKRSKLEKPKLKKFEFHQFEYKLIKPSLNNEKKSVLQFEKKAKPKPIINPQKFYVNTLKGISDTVKQYGDARKAEVKTLPVIYSNFILNVMKKYYGK